MSKKRLHTKRTTLHFVVGNERFPLLLGTNNALRIFMVLSETKSASVIKKFLNVIAYLQSEILIFLVICFFGQLSGDITKISGNMTQVSGDMTSGDMTSGEMTLGRLDRLPL